MNLALPFLFGLAVVALLTSSKSNMIPISLNPRRDERLLPAAPGRKKRKAGAHTVVPFDVETTPNGDVVIQHVNELADAASRALGRKISPQVFALAAMIASEEGGGSTLIKTAVAWAAKNHAARRKSDLLTLLAPAGVLASQSVPRRYASTDEPPTAQDIEIAEKVDAGKVPDLTGGADQFDSPRSQRALLARNSPRYKSTPEEVARERMSHGKVQVTLPGVPADRLRFWRPKQQPAVAAGELAEVEAIMGWHGGHGGRGRGGRRGGRFRRSSLARYLRDGGNWNGAFDALDDGEVSPEEIDYYLRAAPPIIHVSVAPADYESSFGHDTTIEETAIGAIKRMKVPTTPVPKLVEALAKKWGEVWTVPKAFVQTIANIESSDIPAKTNTNERAIKLGGAWGLMQITWATAPDLVRAVRSAPETDHYTEILRVLRDKWHGEPEDLLDPELNIMLGSYFLSRLFREFPRIDQVAAGYHAGRGAVHHALSKGGNEWKKLLGPYSRTYIAMAEKAYPQFA